MKFVEYRSFTLVSLRYGYTRVARSIPQNGLECVEDRAMSGAPLIDHAQILGGRPSGTDVFSSPVNPRFRATREVSLLHFSHLNRVP
jgi:hypothetical protein